MGELRVRSGDCMPLTQWKDSCLKGFHWCCETAACCLLPACLKFKSPEMAEQRDMAVAQAVGEATGQPASKQAFLQLSARVRNRRHWAED